MAPKSDPRYPTMSQQLQTQKYSKKPSGFHAYQPTFEERVCDGEKIMLLKAPSIESAPVWKEQSFSAVHQRMRHKLRDAGAEKLIAVFAEHFPLSTHAAEHEARRVVQVFRKSFGLVENLEPTSFIDVSGVDVTAKMCNKTRPENVVHLGVKATIDMDNINEAFVNENFVLHYFLSLPQSFTVPALRTAEIMDATATTVMDVPVADDTGENFFTPVKKHKGTAGVGDYNAGAPSNLSAEFGNATTESMDTIFAPKLQEPGPTSERKRSSSEIVVEVEDDDNNDVAAPENEVNEREQTKSNETSLKGNLATEAEGAGHQAKSTTTGSTTAPAETDAGKKKAKKANKNKLKKQKQKEHKRAEFEELLMVSPKTAKLLMQHNTVGATGSTVYTYHGPIDILDNQGTFSSLIQGYEEMYELKPGAKGTPSVKDFKQISKKLEKVCNNIQYRVFIREYKRAYVGESSKTSELMSTSTSRLFKQLQAIKMNYFDRTANRLVETTPDTVYKKMMCYVTLLPDDISSWGFVLPWVYFENLSEDLKRQMTEKGTYTATQREYMRTKNDQIVGMTECRDAAKREYDKLIDLRKAVERCVHQKPHTTTARGYMIHDNHAYSNHDFEHVHESHGAVYDTLPTYRFNQVSRAEQTFQSEMNKKREQMYCPDGFEQKFKVLNGKRYPYHPSGNGEWSRFEEGFRGCYGCGSEKHSYKDCETRTTEQGRRQFNFDLHCHKPSFFFKHRPNYAQQRRPMNQSGGRGIDRTQPAWMTQNRDSGPYRRTGDHTSKSYVVRAKLMNMTETKRRRMPIDSLNELVHISFPIGLTESDATITALYDTGAALNTGSYAHHRHIMETSPELVHEYEEFDGENPFDPIKLEGAITNPQNYDENQHGILCAVIRYRTPFPCKNGFRLLSFALGKDISVDAIIGLPTIMDLELTYTFKPYAHISSDVLQRTFAAKHKSTTLTKYSATGDEEGTSNTRSDATAKQHE